MCKPLHLICVGVLMAWLPGLAWAEDHAVSSLEALLVVAEQDGNTVVMAPGVYSVRDDLTPERLAAVGRGVDRTGPGRPSLPVLTLSGSDNTFNLAGVVLEVDTRIYDELPTFGYHRFLFVSGDRNVINGLTIRYVGPNQGTNGNVLSLWGDGNTLVDVTVNVHGSSPYGYGDLLGKGKNSIVPMRKQSGIMVGGDNSTLRGCKVISRAFGHCFYVQGARDTVMEGCYAEGEMRATDDMLAETSGPAFENGFRTVYKPYVIQSGYMKSLSECGFRTYGKGGPRGGATGKVTLVNCVAKNVRVGFAFALPGGAPARLEGCEAVGCERGYFLSGAVAENCRGDAQFGPLLYLKGDPSRVGLTLMPAASGATVHALATVCGEGHVVSLKGGDVLRDTAVPILVGYHPPSAGEISAPIGESAARGIRLENTTGMPVVFGPKSSGVRVWTNGPVLRDEGQGNEVVGALD